MMQKNIWASAAHKVGCSKYFLVLRGVSTIFQNCRNSIWHRINKCFQLFGRYNMIPVFQDGLEQFALVFWLILAH